MVRGPRERQGSQLVRCTAEGCKASVRLRFSPELTRPAEHDWSLRAARSTLGASAPRGPGLPGAQPPPPRSLSSHLWWWHTGLATSQAEDTLAPALSARRLRRDLFPN